MLTMVRKLESEMDKLRQLSQGTVNDVGHPLRFRPQSPHAGPSRCLKYHEPSSRLPPPLPQVRHESAEVKKAVAELHAVAQSAKPWTLFPLAVCAQCLVVAALLLFRGGGGGGGRHSHLP